MNRSSNFAMLSRCSACFASLLVCLLSTRVSVRCAFTPSCCCDGADVGESEPRMIASGLRAFYKVEEVANRDVIVLCNLKGKKVRVCASRKDWLIADQELRQTMGGGGLRY